MRALLLLLLLFPFAAMAATVNLGWQPYPTPGGHEIAGQCKVDAGAYTALATVTADKTNMSGSISVNPGQKVTCRVRANRLSDSIPSNWSLEVAHTIPLDPTAPAGVTITVDR